MESAVIGTGGQWSKYADSSTVEGILPRLMEPELMMPSQFFDRFRGSTLLEGERRLMLAVLEDAVSCFQKYAGASRPRARRLYQEAEDWILDTDDAWPFSFEAVCVVLGYDSSYVRRRLLDWKEQLLAQGPEERAKIGRVRLRAARRHKILPFVPRRRNKKPSVAAVG